MITNGRIGRARVQVSDTGIITLSRNDRVAISELDDQYVRLPDQMAWRPKCIFNPNRSVFELKPLFDKHCYIVGKGLSADRLREKHFPTDDPIIAINDAMLFMEKLHQENQVIGITQDYASDVTIRPEKAILLIKGILLPIYAKYPRTYVPNQKQDFGITHACCSVIVAIGCAKAMGCKTVTLYGFDQFTTGSLEYGKMANIRNERSTNTCLRKQKDHFQYLDMSELELRWVLPDLENYLPEV